MKNQKIAFITGCSGELGIDIAKRLISEKFKLICHIRKKNQEFSKFFKKNKKSIIKIVHFNLLETKKITKPTKKKKVSVKKSQILKNNKEKISKNKKIKKNEKTNHSKIKKNVKMKNNNEKQIEKPKNLKENLDKKIENDQKSGWWAE